MSVQFSAATGQATPITPKFQAARVQAASPMKADSVRFSGKTDHLDPATKAKLDSPAGKFFKYALLSSLLTTPVAIGLGVLAPFTGITAPMACGAFVLPLGFGVLGVIKAKIKNAIILFKAKRAQKAQGN